MDALHWIETRFERHKVFRYALIFFAFYAPLSYILGRLAKGKGWLNDFDALACGADYVRRGLSPYVLQPVCEGLNPAPYVYAPQWAHALAPVIDTIGMMPFKAIYAVVYIAVLWLFAWYGLKTAVPRLTKPVRLMAFCILTGSSIQSGNIGIFCHALVLLTALGLSKRRWLFLIAVLLTSLIKPVMLTYLVVLLLEDRPIHTRIGYAAIGAVAGLSGAWAVMATAGPLGPVWQNALTSIVLTDQPGSGFFGWLGWFGVSGASGPGLGLFGLYFIFMLCAGFVLAEFAAKDTQERLILGLGMAALLNPRLMDYDLLGIPLSLALLPVLALSLPEQTRRWVGNGFAGIYLTCLILNLLVLKGLKPAPFAVLIMAGLTGLSAVMLALKNKNQLLDRRFWAQRL